VDVSFDVIGDWFVVVDDVHGEESAPSDFERWRRLLLLWVVLPTVFIAIDHAVIL